MASSPRDGDGGREETGSGVRRHGNFLCGRV